MSPTLDEAAAELYAVEPGRFTAERTRLTSEARSAGETDTAKAIGELRRPTTSAWLVNQLVRGEQDAGAEVERLDQLGRELREAQAALDAVRMRELTRQRHQLVGALVRRADDVAAEAGQKISAAVRRELEDTLGAAVADEQASWAVMSGRLTRALTYAGFGEVDITEATATPLRESKLAPKPKPSSEHEARARPGSEEGTRSGAGSTGRPASQGDTEAKTGEGAKTRSVPKTDSGETGAASSHRTSDTAKAEKQAARRTQAEDLVTQARADLDTAEESLRQKEHELEEATSEQADLQTRLDELQAEVVAVRRKLDTGDRQVSHAERDVQRQERQLKDATKALNRAEAALDRLDPA